MSTMRGAKFYNPGDIRIEDFPIPTPGPNECLVEVEWNGICGSDLHIYLEGARRFQCSSTYCADSLN
jgi:threonine dehydrogenase-like Zn-dependent dehydrogenase